MTINNLKAELSISLNAPVSKVWKAVTDPAQIKQYMFGTDTVSDWKKGSTITYSGEFKGKPYQDKGTIVDIVPGHLLHTTHYSPLSGKEDKPENYAHVIYSLKPDHDRTIFTVSQDNIDNEKTLQENEANWNMILEGLKKVVEQ